MSLFSCAGFPIPYSHRKIQEPGDAYTHCGLNFRESNPKLREPTFFTMGCKQTCLTFALKRDLTFIILDNNKQICPDGRPITSFLTITIQSLKIFGYSLFKYL